MSIERNWSGSAVWDAGQLGCGGLILGLRRALDPLRGGDLLELQADDAGARVDVPAWCRLTGHELVQAAHPHYFILKKGD